MALWGLRRARWLTGAEMMLWTGEGGVYRVRSSLVLAGLWGVFGRGRRACCRVGLGVDRSLFAEWLEGRDRRAESTFSGLRVGDMVVDWVEGPVNKVVRLNLKSLLIWKESRSMNLETAKLRL